MTFKDAQSFTMPFGKYKGRKLEAIAVDDVGLQYLDWLRGERKDDGSPLNVALAAYLDDPAIQQELKNL